MHAHHRLIHMEIIINKCIVNYKKKYQSWFHYPYFVSGERTVSYILLGNSQLFLTYEIFWEEILGFIARGQAIRVSPGTPCIDKGHLPLSPFFLVCFCCCCCCCCNCCCCCCCLKEDLMWPNLVSNSLCWSSCLHLPYNGRTDTPGLCDASMTPMSLCMSSRHSTDWAPSPPPFSFL